jgi:hypothetical protein
MFPAAGLMLLVAIPASVDAREAERVVAIGDVHGDFDALVEILQRAGLVDEYARWSGGAATLVQTGDFLDRGARVREVMDLLMRLQQEAPQAGGEVVVLLGNHEAMNLLGIWRDVADEAFAAFAGPASAQRRQESWQTFVRWSARVARRRGVASPSLGPIQRAEFERRFPLGFFEYVDALGPEGRYGLWLRTLPIVARRADGVFLHGGISPAYEGWSVERFNDAARAEIAGLDDCRTQLLADGTAHETLDLSDRTIEARAELEALLKSVAKAPAARAGELELSIATLQRCTDYKSWLLIAEDGPVWFRGLARWSEEEGLREAPRLLAALAASYFVAGHTPQSEGRIQRRFGGLAYLIDTGMLRVVYKGTPSALEIVGDRFFALYPEAKEELDGPEPLASATSAALAPALVQ